MQVAVGVLGVREGVAECSVRRVAHEACSEVLQCGRDALLKGE